MRGIGRAVDVAAELLLGAACPGCSAPGFGLCTECRIGLAAPEPHRTEPTPCSRDFPLTVSGGPYDDLLHAVIPAHKERQAWLLTAPLADRLAGAVCELIMVRGTDRPLVLVPVPSTPAAVRTRGRDATAAIAGATVRRLRRDLDRPISMIKLLRPIRRLADQSELTESERRRNLAGAYAARPSAARRLGSAAVILVDDLVTTGSSLTEASRAVAVTGAPVLGAAVVAATQRRHPRSTPPSEGC